MLKDIHIQIYFGQGFIRTAEQRSMHVKSIHSLYPRQLYVENIQQEIDILDSYP